MIDIEKSVYTRVFDAVSSAFSNISIHDENLLLPSEFPCLTIEEADNYAYDRTQDSGSLENHAVLMYEVNIYSNKATRKKDECKAIQKVVDREFENMGFTRISKIPMTTNNATVFRMVSRYTAVANNNEIYRR